MKICSYCKESKPESQYNKKKDGLQPFCRECNKQKSREYYNSNKEKHKKVIGERNKKHRKSLREYIINAKSGKACLDCNISYPWYVMDFDHVRGEKRAAISEMVNSSLSLDTIIQEIEKCELVCANCHRMRTFKDVEMVY